MSDNPWLNRSVDELELAVRTANGLESLGIRTVQQLISLSAADLLASKKLGRLSVRELEELLGEMGLSLRKP